ncbi:MAG: T9SS type A sorting domain-containing protein [Ferruginibacter sp.]|nr:T9SS type A sorting domain-containing protein [Ferruginibacter sp.]
MKQLFIFIVLFTITYNISAQHPWMIKDINATNNYAASSPVGNNGSNPVNPYSVNRYFSVNGVSVFSANDGINGDGLWRSDGTAAGTYLLQLFASTTQTIISMYETGPLLYFTVANTFNLIQGGSSLWRTDGTVAGTFQIFSNQKHTISPDLCNKYYSTSAAVLGSEFYFMVTDTLPDVVINGNNYLNIHDRVYKTDGTINGTSMYYDSPGAHWNGYQNNGSHTISGINQINASGNKLYLIYQETTLGDDYNLFSLFPTSLARADGVNPPVTIFTPPYGTNGGNTNMNVFNTADANGNYLLINGIISGQYGLYRLYPNETTPVWIDTSNYPQSVDFTGQTIGLFNPAIGNRFFYRSTLGKLKVTDGTIAGTYNFEEPDTRDQYFLGGIANNKILVSNLSHSFFWDGTSPTSYVQIDSLNITPSGQSPGANLRVFQTNSKLFYLGDFANNIAWTSELDGSNFLRVFYSQAMARGALTSNGIIDGITTGGLNNFDAGYEPGIFKTNFKIFTGSVSNNWGTANNWSPAGVPGSTDDVVIPALDASKVPVISSAAACNNLTLCNGLLTINGANLNINGNVANYLSTVAGTGSVTLKSTTGTKMSGLLASLFDVANIYINGTDVSFGTTGAAFNSVVTFQTDNKILATYTGINFNKPPFIMGYNDKRFVVTGQQLVYNNAGSTTTADSIFTMPIGNSSNSYTPVSFISNNNIDYNTGTIFLSVADSINKNGTTGDLITNTVVVKCWSIVSSIFNSKVSLSWNANNETPFFNRNSCHIAYNSSGLGDGSWVGGTNQAATLQNGMYTLSQRYDQLPYARFIVLNDSFNLALATSNITNTQPISGNTTYNDGMSIINTIVPNGNSPVSGDITVSVTIDPTVQSFAAQPYVQRHYDIEPVDNASTATATVTLYYSQDEFTAYNIAAGVAGLPLLPINAIDAANYKNNLLIDQYHGIGTVPGNYTGYTGIGAAKVRIAPTVSWNNNDARWQATFPVTGFSGFYATTYNGVLPVALTNFTAVLHNNQTILNWATSSEINNKGYDIERSTDAAEFKKIGYLAGKGTSNLQQQYLFIDAQPTVGINYYRLKQIDLNANYKYSMVRQITNIGIGKSLRIYPNPATNNLNVSTTSLLQKIQITDMAGHTVITAIRTGNNTIIGISKLSAGTYICKIGSSQILFVKQ